MAMWIKHLLLALGVIAFFISPTNAEEAHKDHFFDLLLDGLLKQVNKRNNDSFVYRNCSRVGAHRNCRSEYNVDFSYGPEGMPVVGNIKLRNMLLQGLKNVNRRDDSLMQADSLKLKMHVDDLNFFVTGQVDVWRKTIKRDLMATIGRVDVDTTLSWHPDDSSRVILKEFKIINIDNFSLKAIGPEASLFFANILIDTTLSTFQDQIKNGMERILRIYFDHKVTSDSRGKSPKFPFILRFSRTFYNFRTSGYYVWLPIPFVTFLNFVIPYLI